MEFEIESETIKLDQLLKAAGVCISGGEAHAMVDEGLVQVDGRVTDVKRLQIRPGQTINCQGKTILVRSRRSS